MNVSQREVELLRRMRRDYEAARASGEPLMEIVLAPEDFETFRYYIQGFGALSSSRVPNYNPMSFNGLPVRSA